MMYLLVGLPVALLGALIQIEKEWRHHLRILAYYTWSQSSVVAYLVGPLVGRVVAAAVGVLVGALVGLWLGSL